VEQAETEQNFHEMYDLQQILGEGAFARVYKAHHVEYQVECAVKIVDLRDDSHKDGNEPESQVSNKKNETDS
jgi:serine/threonine protein kinase